MLQVVNIRNYKQLNIMFRGIFTEVMANVTNTFTHDLMTAVQNQSMDISAAIKELNDHLQNQMAR